MPFGKGRFLLRVTTGVLAVGAADISLSGCGQTREMV
jgi:hypothetical protein